MLHVVFSDFCPALQRLTEIATGKNRAFVHLHDLTIVLRYIWFPKHMWSVPKYIRHVDVNTMNSGYCRGWGLYCRNHYGTSGGLPGLRVSFLLYPEINVPTFCRHHMPVRSLEDPLQQAVIRHSEPECFGFCGYPTHFPKL